MCSLGDANAIVSTEVAGGGGAVGLRGGCGGGGGIDSTPGVAPGQTSRSGKERGRPRTGSPVPGWPAQPGAVAVTRHHQHVSALGGRNDQPLDPAAAAKLRPRLASKPRLRSGHQVGRGLLRWGVDPLGWVASRPRPAPPSTSAHPTPLPRATNLDRRGAAPVPGSVQDDRLYAAWRLAALTGMRRGEVLGLRWADLDLEGGWFSVRHTLIVVDNHPQLSQPKTAGNSTGASRANCPGSAITTCATPTPP